MTSSLRKLMNWSTPQQGRLQGEETMGTRVYEGSFTRSGHPQPSIVRPSEKYIRSLVEDWTSIVEKAGRNRNWPEARVT